MTVPVAEIKLGIGIIKWLSKYFKRISSNKKEKTIVSEIFKELLLGDKSDFAKIESMMMQVENIGAVSPDYMRAKEYVSKAKSSMLGAKSHGTAKKVVKKSAARVGKPTCRKVAKKTSYKRSAAKRA